MNKKIFKVSKRLLEYLDKILDYILAVLFSGMTLLIFLEISGRYLFSFTIMWSEELARYFSVWVIWLGAARAFTLKRHLLVGFFISRIKKHFRIYIEIFIYVLMIIFLFYISLKGIQYSSLYWYSSLHTTQFLNLGLVYSIIPIASIIMILNILRVIIEEVVLYKKVKDGGGEHN